MTNPTTTEPMTMTVEDAAKLLGVSRSAAYRAVAAGQIPTLRVGRRLLVPTAILDRLLGLQSSPAISGSEPAGSTVR